MDVLHVLVLELWPGTMLVAGYLVYCLEAVCFGATAAGGRAALGGVMQRGWACLMSLNGFRVHGWGGVCPTCLGLGC